MLSVGWCDEGVIRERDLQIYRRVRATAADAGLRLIDWIEVHGRQVRSFADLIEPGRRWPGSAPGPTSGAVE